MSKIRAKKETCPKCGATEVENLVRIEDGHPMKVYVRCTGCGTFVARYMVSTYTPDMTYESLLKVLRTNELSCHDCRSSSRELEAFSVQVRREFERTVEKVQRHSEKRLIVEMLDDEGKKRKRG